MNRGSPLRALFLGWGAQGALLWMGFMALNICLPLARLPVSAFCGLFATWPQVLVCLSRFGGCCERIQPTANTESGALKVLMTSRPQLQGGTGNCVPAADLLGGHEAPLRHRNLCPSRPVLVVDFVTFNVSFTDSNNKKIKKNCEI